MKPRLLIIAALSLISFAGFAQVLKEKPLVVINGKISGWDMRVVDPDNISSVDILKSDSAVADYGILAKDGVIKVITKDFNPGDTSINRKPLVILNGELFTDELNTLSPSNILSMDVIKASSKTELYGKAGENGIIVITTKDKIKP